MTLPIASDGCVNSHPTAMCSADERLMMTCVQQFGSMQDADIVRCTGLSIEAVSDTLDDLEREKLLVRQTSLRGGNDKYSPVVSINPDGGFSVGLKIGRRTCELVLMDLTGAIRASASRAYAYPIPEEVFSFLQMELPDIVDAVPASQRHDIAGIGIAMPFELWNWAHAVGQGGTAEAGLADWKQMDISARVAELSQLPVHVQNDATSACQAELTFGNAPALSDFAYFFVGYFIGGGVVVNHAVYYGPTGNAGALGSLPVAVGRHGSSQLLDKVSLANLEFELTQQGIDPTPIWASPNAWTTFGSVLDQWIDDSAQYLAHAALTCCSVIDFQAIIIDGAIPDEVRTALVEKTNSAFEAMNSKGVERPAVLAGSIGHGARSLGAAALPMFHRYFLDDNRLSQTANQPV